jgi:hypothetical protein
MKIRNQSKIERERALKRAWYTKSKKDRRGTFFRLPIKTSKGFFDICNVLRVPAAPMLEQILEQWFESDYVKSRLTAISATRKVLGKKEYREMRGPVSRKNLPECRWFVCEECERRRARQKRAV